MDIIELGAIGELVGGCGRRRVASLRGLPGSSKHLAGTSRCIARDIQNQWDDWPKWIIGSKEVREAWAAAVGWDPDRTNVGNPRTFPSAELGNFHLLMYRLANTMRSQYRMLQAGQLGETEAEQLRALIQVYTTSPSAIDWWTRQAPQLFDRGFVDFVRAEATSDLLRRRA